MKIHENLISGKINPGQNLVKNAHSVPNHNGSVTDSNRSPYLSNQGAYEYVDEDWQSLLNESQDSAELKSSQSSYLLDGTCGIDKARIAVPLDHSSLHLQTLMRKLIKPKNPLHSPMSGKAKLDGFPELFVRWDYAQHRLEIEFNPSDFTRPEGLELCPFGVLIPISEFTIRHVLAVDRVLPAFAINDDYLSGRYDFRRGWTKLIDISRIDSARDFKITDSRFSLEQIRHTYPRRSRGQTSSQFRNEAKLNTLSFPTSGGTTKIKLYDKFEERKNHPVKSFPGNPIPRGTFRFEASYPREQLNYSHMKTLDLFTPMRLEKMLKKKWVDSNFWVNLTWEGQASFDAHNAGLTAQRVNEVLGFAQSTFYGIEMEYSYRERKSLKSDARKLGINIAAPIEKSGLPYGHLDFNSGDVRKPLPLDFSLSKDDLFGMIND